MEEPLSPTASLLQELSSQLNLDLDTQQQANHFFQFFKSNRTCVFFTQDVLKEKSYIRCAVLMASKTTKVSTLAGDSVPASFVSVAQVLRIANSPSLPEFIPDLLTFAEGIDIPESLKSQVRDMTHSYAFSMTFFKKFEELWSALRVKDRSDREDVVEKIKETTWLLFILSRQRLLQQSSDVIETTNLLIAVIDLVARFLPSSVSTAVSGMEHVKALEFLCAFVKSRASVAMKAVTDVEALVSQLHEQELIRANFSEPPRFEGLFASAHIPYNLQKLNQAYVEQLTPVAIDERDFITTCHKVGTPIKQARVITPFAKHGTAMSGRLASHRVIKWDEVESQLTMESNLKDFSNKTLSQQTMKSAVATPVTMAMEMNNWMHDQVELIHMDGVLTTSVSEKLKEFQSLDQVRDLVSSLGQAMSCKFKDLGIGTVTTRDLSFIEQHFSGLSGALPLMTQEYLFSNSKVDLILKLFAVMLDKTLRLDDPRLIPQKSTCSTSAFLRSLMACCMETSFFLHNITTMDFEDVLGLCQVSSVELWNVINLYVQVDPRMPMPLKQHFRRIEVKILSSLGWKSGSEVFELLVKPTEAAEQQFPLDRYFKRVLSQAAHRILSLSECMQLHDDVKESIWTLMKFVLSDCTELLKDRHLDQLVLCCVYAICKTFTPVSFNNINENYAKLNPEEAGDITKSVLIETGLQDNIIRFYNKVFLLKTKEFIATRDVPAAGKPRIAQLCPASPLRANLPAPVQSYSTLSAPKIAFSGVSRSPLSSPFMTPRTKMLYARKESPMVSAERQTLHSDRKLVFDDDDKKPTFRIPNHLSQILSPSNSLPFTLPQLKSEEKKP